MTEQPPNILLVHSDQHRFDCVATSPSSPKILKTPYLDHLAGEGVSFHHAFTPNPVCSPARACLQTGTWSSTHGCLSIPPSEGFASADSSLPVLTQLLADCGYQVGHVGKFHKEIPGAPTDHGVQDYIPHEDYPRWRAQQGLPPEPRKNGWFGEIDSGISPEQSALGWEADHVINLLSRYAKEQTPFFIRWDPAEPHLPSIPPQPYGSMYPPEKLQPWPSFPDPLKNKPPVQRRSRRRWQVEDWGWEKWAPIVSRYLGVISLLDDQIGRLLDKLDCLGISENTLVVYTTDHGDMCGGHGMMDKHYVMYDDIMRVPLIMRWPGHLPAGQTSQAFVSHEIDLAKTFLELSGADVPKSFVGRNLIEDATAPPEKARQDIFSQYHGTTAGLYSARMLRNRRWKYVFNPVAFDELYDLDNDPGELTNLIDAPKHQSTLHNLRVRMGQWMQEINDPLSPPLYVWK